MIKLTMEREITPYVWVHPGDDDRRYDAGAAPASPMRLIGVAVGRGLAASAAGTTGQR